MNDKQQNDYPDNQSNRDALMDEFLKVYAATREYMEQHLQLRLWEAGEAAHQLEKLLQEHQTNKSTLDK